ncbi:MAG: prolyl oligopeptidase family serine peptidase [Acidobacteriota bacterium]
MLLIGVTVEAFSQTRPVSIDDVLGMKAVGSPVVSPDGRQVLYTVRAWEQDPEQPDNGRMESRTHVWKVPAAGGSARQVTFGASGEQQPQWSPDGRHISFVAARGTSSGEEAARPQLYLMRSDGGEAWKLTDVKEGVSSYAWAPDSGRIAFVSTTPRSESEESATRRRDDERVFEGDFRFQHIWVIDILSKEVRAVTRGTDFTVSGAVSWASDSQRLTFSAKPTPMLRDGRSDVYIADLTGAVTRITTNPGSDAQPRWSPDGTLIAWVAEPASAAPIADGTFPSYIGHGRLMIYDVRSGEALQRSHAQFDVDMTTPHWMPDSRSLVFTAGKRAFTEAFRFDLASGAYTQLTRQRTLQYGSRSRDGSVIAVTMDSPDRAGDVFVTDPSFGSFRRLTDTNPQAASFALGASEVVTWKSSDGLEVEGVLLKPVGFTTGTRYPLLVVAHGGPAGVFTNNFRVGGLEGGQLWAGQGWAVFYPNPRGSSSYGEKFLRANLHDWGGGDYRDIMTGVDMLVAKGIADPDRLAHIGWSYGGYMTAWVITQTTRFKAAMVGAGLTNMASMYGTNDIPNVLITYFGGILGKRTQPLYSERSAMTFIDNVQTPTLILHGAGDERVPTGQAFELFRGLKDRGKVTELVFYPREGHGIGEYHHIKDRMARIFDWVTRYTPGTAKTTTR